MGSGSNMSYLKLAMLVIVGTLLYKTNEVSGQCGGSLPEVISECSKFVQKTGPTIPPSPGCCSAMRSFDVPCACKLVTKEVEKFVSIPKTIFVARSCGLKVPPGLQCGSVRVPPKAMK